MLKEHINRNGKIIILLSVNRLIYFSIFKPCTKLTKVTLVLKTSSSINCLPPGLKRLKVLLPRLIQ